MAKAKGTMKQVKTIAAKASQKPQAQKSSDQAKKGSHCQKCPAFDESNNLESLKGDLKVPCARQ